MKPRTTEPKLRLCRNWLDGLIASTQAIGEWESNAMFWPRLAVLTFVNAKILQFHLPESADADFLPPATAVDGMAMDYFRGALAEGMEERSQLLPAALRTGLCQGLDKLPRAFCPRETENNPDLFGRWLVEICLRLGLEKSPLTVDFHDRLVAIYEQTPFSVDRFLTTRLTVWLGSKVEDIAAYGPVHDFVMWFHRHSDAEARIMPWVVAHFEELGTSRQPIWHPDRWLNAGWKAAPVLTSIEEYRTIFETAPVENVRLTHRLYRKLASMLSSDPQFDEVATGALQYLKEFGYDKRGPGHNAVLCLRSFDYSLWMRLAHAGLVPVPNETDNKE